MYRVIIIGHDGHSLLSSRCDNNNKAPVPFSQLPSIYIMNPSPGLLVCACAASNVLAAPKQRVVLMNLPTTHPQMNVLRFAAAIQPGADPAAGARVGPAFQALRLLMLATGWTALSAQSPASAATREARQCTLCILPAHGAQPQKLCPVLHSCHPCRPCACSQCG